MVGVIVAVVVVVFLLIMFARTVRIVPQARAGIVERLGRYNRTLSPGLAILMPFMDRVKPLLDLREQVVTFPPQPVITEDNLVVQIDTVLYFTITDPKSATYDGDDAAQCGRRDVARDRADQPGPRQRHAARRAGRGHRQVGNPDQPG
jgi:regulator of protease activity HflC (stomatin/prohibitin superfamily)